MDNNSRNFKDALYLQFSRIGKSISSPKRLELLDLLLQSPKTVETLADYSKMSMANVSQHLQVLHEARMVRSQKQGTYVIYRLASEEVMMFILAMRQLSEKQLPDVQMLKDQFLTSPNQLEPIPLPEILRRVKEKSAILVDVRPLQEFEAGHIPGAISIPHDELEKHLHSLPRDKEIVAYCRGPYCLYGIETAEFLQQHGFTASRIEEGFLEWKMLKDETSTTSIH